MAEPIDQKRVVKLYLPLSKKKGSYFSGYIIADGVIITCRHGFLVGKKAYATGFTIDVISQGYKSEISLDGSKNIKELLSNNIVLFQSKKYDIVLLKDKDAKGEFSPLSLSEWNHPGKWEGGGYPHYNKDEITSKGYESLDGSVRAASINGKVLKLKSTDEPEDIEDWAKVSGSPIFLDGKLAGIVKNYVGNVKNRLEATYLKRLWDEKDPKEELFKKAFEKFLPSSQKNNENRLREFLNKNVGFELKRALNAQFNPDGKKELIAEIIKSDRQSISDACANLRDQEDIKDFLDAAMVCKYSSENWLDETDEEYKKSPFVRDESIEYAKAAKDGRSPAFIQTEKSIVAGEFSIPSPAFDGMNVGACSSIENDAAASQASLSHFRKHLVEASSPSYSYDYYNNEGKNRLEKRTLKSGYYYWIVNPINESTNGYLKASISAVHKKYEKEIDIIEKAEDKNAMRTTEESDIFDPLKDILTK